MNRKVKQIIIWRLQNRHLILNQLRPHLDGDYLNIVEYFKIEGFWKENYALKEKENNLIWKKKFENYLMWNSDFFFLVIKEYDCTGQAPEVYYNLQS